MKGIVLAGGSGIYFGDNSLNIGWLVSKSDLIISTKDEHLPSFLYVGQETNN